MSETPRTDEQEYFIDGDRGIVDSGLARELECELNAANERINQLKEALESIRDHADDEWRKAKKAKP